ncbi:MAG: c-type cytochrome [Candidatus Marinimicrobia bacterium]|nr:c-type cytochrome [Candidatus Neomarinimicrobiota bacterium]
MRIPYFISGLIFLTSAVGYAQNSPEQYFQTNCQACHTIGGGKLIGPDLKDVETRQTREWLINWITDPASVLASGDPYAAKILIEANNVPMVPSPGINAELAARLLDYILEIATSGTPVVAYIPPTFTPEDIVIGKAIFLGKQKLTNTGPPCVSCHQVNSLSGLGGGKLGVNLTDVYFRLGEARGLTNWLKAPPTVTMSPVFADHPLTDEEIVELMAFFKNEGETTNAPTLASVANFILYGILGTILLFVLIGSIWSGRFTAVRKPMIAASKHTKSTIQG